MRVILISVAIVLSSAMRSQNLLAVGSDAVTEDVLGFVNGPRPPFDFPGAWLYSAGHPVLHLNDISQTDKQQRPDSGVIDHVAFGCRGFQAMKQHLTGKGVPHHVNQVPNSARWQIFLRDPNNIEIELNFETKNEAAA